jgi:hypothetical protein
MKRVEAFQNMRKDQANIERLTAAARSAKAALKGGPRLQKSATEMSGAFGNKRNKENVASLNGAIGGDRARATNLSPSRRSTGATGEFGMLNANSYR